VVRSINDAIVADLKAQLEQSIEKGPAALVEAALDVFFQALMQSNLERAIATPEALRQLFLQNQEMQAWAGYMETILDIEDYRWDVAESRALQALQWTNAPKLRGRLYNELGILSDQLGRWGDAIRYYRDALPLFQAAREQVYIGKIRKNLGTALVRGVEAGELPREALQEAEMQEIQALEIFESLKIESLVAATCNELGTVFKAQGRWQEARRCYERFGAFCRAHQDARGEGQAINNLAETYLAQDEAVLAVEQWKQALSLVAGHFWDEVDVRTHLAHSYKMLGDFFQARMWSDSAIGLVESMRARQTSPDVRVDFFALHQRPYQIAAGVALASGDLMRTLTIAERARARTFAEMLARRYGDDANFEGERPITAEEILAQMPAETGLLAYFETDETLIAMLAKKDSLTIRSLNIRQDELAAASFDLHGRPRGFIHESGRLGKPWILDKLGALLLSPLARELKGLETLWLIPYGVLHHLPLSVMPVWQDGTSLEASTPRVVQVPSASIALRRLGQPRHLNEGFFFGFNANALKYAENEAAILARRGGGRAFVGSRATLGAMKKALSRAGVLHLACPGVFRPDQPLQSGLMLADGFLDVMSILQMQGVRAGLVTLSACETGRGRVRGGEEILGLVRAWLYAGCSAVLVSLWQVDDLATLLFMDAFYQKLEELDVAAALSYARHATRTWNIAQVEERYQILGGEQAGWERERERLTLMWRGRLPEHPLDHPYFWAGFSLHSGIDDSVQNLINPSRPAAE